MPQDVAKLLVEIDATTSLLRTQMRQAEREVSGFARSADRDLKRVDAGFANAGKGASAFGTGMARLKSSVSGFATGAVTGLVASFGVGAITNAVTNALAFADAIGDTAEQLGVSAEFLQEFRFAAEEFGGSVEGADNALGKFNLSLGKAQTGNKAAVASYRDLGVEVLDASGKARSAEAVYRDVAGAIARIPDPTLQAAAAQKIFGKGYQDIIPLLRQGAEGFDLTVEKARSLGLVLSSDDLAKMGEVNRDLEVLNATLQVKFATVVRDNADAIGVLADGLIGLVGAAGDAARGWGNLYKVLSGGAAQEKRALEFRKAMLAGDVVADPMGRPAGRGLSRNSITSGGNSMQGWGSAAPQPIGQPKGWAQPVRTGFGGRAGGGMAAAIGAVDFGLVLEAAQAAGMLADAAPAMAALEQDSRMMERHIAGLNDEGKAMLDDLRASNQLALLRAQGRTREAEQMEAMRRVEEEVYRIEGLTEDQRRELLKLAQDLTAQGLEQVRLAEERLALEERWADTMAEASRPDLSAGGDAADQANEAWDIYQRRGEETQRYLAGTFENLMMNGTKGIWAQFKAEAIRVLAALMAEQLTALLGGLGGGGGGYGGGILGGILDGIGIAGFRANGGSVNAGRAYVVGERRPELFVPSVPGRILPRVPQGGGGETLIVQVDKSALFDVHVRRTAATEAAGAVSQSQRGESGRMITTMRRRG